MILDLLNMLVQTAGDTAAQGECPQAFCPARAFTAIAAAFSTEGYFMQSDILFYLRFGTFNAWAPFLYVCAAIGGMMSMVLGAPPRNYMWFFIGPALYAWLIDTTQVVHGVRWSVAGVDQDQSEVWRLAEVGLKNSGPVTRRYMDSFGAGGMGPPDQSSQIQIYTDKMPSQGVPIATMFLWFDELISSQAQWLTNWTGVYRAYDAGSASTDGHSSTGSGVGGEGKWFLLSNVKWQILDSITDARLHDAELRDSFSTFMSSECGDALVGAIDQARFASYANARGRTINPDEEHTIFVTANGTTEAGINLRQSYLHVTKLLSRYTIPTPDSLLAFIDPESYLGTPVGPENFKRFAGFLEHGAYRSKDEHKYNTGFDDRVTCPQYLWLLVHGFRWEAGQIYRQVLHSAPGELKDNDDKLVHALFYGWHIKDGNGDDLDTDSLKQYLYNLILIHLFRNELMIVKQLVNPRFASSSETLRSVEQAQRSVGSKTKYGELYSWAMMIPYIQGMLLYLLAIAYPFACLLMIVPGWHKTIFTWASFYAWTKLWDVGFALCTVFERSLWASIGSNSDTASVSSLIAGMAHWGSVQLQDKGSGCGDITGPCPYPEVALPVMNDPGIDVLGGGTGGSSIAPVVHDGMQPFFYSLRTLDYSLLLGSNVDLDLANGYYIYLLAALYISVPAVVGQLVLGARSGMASMISSTFGGVATDGGKAAGSGYTSGWQTRAASNQSGMEQAVFAKAMRQSGLGAQALGSGNAALEYGMEGAKYGSANEGIKLMNQAQQSQFESRGAAISTAKSLGQSGLGTFGGGGGGSKGGGGGPISSTASTVWGMAGDLASLDNKNQGLALGVQNAASQGDNIGRQFGAQQRGQAASKMEGRLGNAANFAAQQAVWRAQRDFGNQIASTSAAMGVLAGSFRPGNKPTQLEGLAMSGMLNSYGSDGSVTSDAKGSAWYPSTGFIGAVSSAQGQLASNYGGSAISSQYQSSGIGQGAGTIISSGVSTATNMASSVGMDSLGPAVQHMTSWAGGVLTAAGDTTNAANVTAAGNNFNAAAQASGASLQNFSSNMTSTYGPPQLQPAPQIK